MDMFKLTFKIRKYPIDLRTIDLIDKGVHISPLFQMNFYLINKLFHSFCDVCDKAALIHAVSNVQKCYANYF